MKILVVDDSVVYRSQIKAAISTASFIDKVDTANNGKIALDRIEQNSYDLVLLDLEMPELDGLETLRQLRSRGNEIRVIMFSSQTKRGSDKTLQCLSEGADDFVTKPSGDDINISNAAASIKEVLLPKLRQFIVGSSFGTSSVSGDVEKVVDKKYATLEKRPDEGAIEQQSSRALPFLGGDREVRDYLKKEVRLFNPEVLVIGSSTGGPAALEVVLNQLGPVSIPILITQHMPPLFTASLAKRIEKVSGGKCTEAKDMESLANQIYIAPGDYHMSLINLAGNTKIQLDQKEKRNSVRPAVDYLFESASELYGPKLQGIILTGMGEDGCDGSMKIKAAQGGVIIQNKESCVVFGMPGAVHAVKAYDELMDLNEINDWIKSRCTGR